MTFFLISGALGGIELFFWMDQSKQMLAFPLDVFRQTAWFQIRKADKWKVKSSVTLWPLLVGCSRSPQNHVPVPLSSCDFLTIVSHILEVRVIKSPPQSKATFAPMVQLRSGRGSYTYQVTCTSPGLEPRFARLETDQQLWLICLVPDHFFQNTTKLWPVWGKVGKETMSLIPESLPNALLELLFEQRCHGTLLDIHESSVR